MEITRAALAEWLGEEPAEDAFHDGETGRQKYREEVAGKFVETIRVIDEAIFSSWGGFGDNEKFGFEAKLADLGDVVNL